jgi:sulfur carrier protein ThiS
VVVTVKYVFGLARGPDGRDTLSVELPPGATVFEALRRLGLSALELHAAVNGESAADGTVLRDGDEMILIPSIQGGRAGGVVMKRMVSAVSVLVGLGLVGSAPEPVAAQARVVVPIVIQVPRVVAPRASTLSSSITVTTRTQASPPGTTTTRITVRDTTGAARDLSASPTARTQANAPSGTSSVLVRTRTQASPPGTTTTRITVRDTTGAARDLSASPTAHTQVNGSSGTSSVLVTVDRPIGPVRPGAPGSTRVTVEDASRAGSAAGGPVSTSSQRPAGLGQQTWTITSDAPIAAPIVILGH